MLIASSRTAHSLPVSPEKGERVKRRSRLLHLVLSRRLMGAGGDDRSHAKARARTQRRSLGAVGTGPRNSRSDVRILSPALGTGCNAVFVARIRPANLVGSGRPAIRLSESKERELRRRAAQYTRPDREVIRAKVVVLAAEGHSDAEIARRLDCTDKTAGRWRKRFAAEGIAGLDERPRPGRPRSFSPRRDRRSQGAGVRAAGHLGPVDLAMIGG